MIDPKFDVIMIRRVRNGWVIDPNYSERNRVTAGADLTVAETVDHLTTLVGEWAAAQVAKKDEAL